MSTTTKVKRAKFWSEAADRWDLASSCKPSRLPGLTPQSTRGFVESTQIENKCSRLKWSSDHSTTPMFQMPGHIEPLQVAVCRSQWTRSPRRQLSLSLPPVPGKQHIGNNKAVED